jgi:hypothetical protein
LHQRAGIGSASRPSGGGRVYPPAGNTQSPISRLGKISASTWRA